MAWPWASLLTRLPSGLRKSLWLSASSLPRSRPLIKLHILWKKDGVLLSGGISDYNRRLTIPNPTGSDAGFYECEAVLRSSSVPSVVRGAYLSVLGEMGRGCWGRDSKRVGAAWSYHKEHGSDPLPCLSSCRTTSVCQGAGETHHSRDGESGGHSLSSQR